MRVIAKLVVKYLPNSRKYAVIWKGSENQTITMPASDCVFSHQAEAKAYIKRFEEQCLRTS